MTTLTIQISDKDRDLFERLAKRLNVKILEVLEEDLHPNLATKKAISDGRLRKTKKITNLDSFFKGL
ncbi:hypothetical protein [Pedobacter sp. JCM 36344]|uniref:hypothetical protein n=1 Tax=Pedobacter sp. JCM 36344 TaxID=3374280 RepID=UPI00397A33DE